MQTESIQNDILACLKSRYQIEVESLFPILGGAESTAASFRVDFKGSSYFVKVVEGPVNLTRFATLALMRDANIPHLIQPILDQSGGMVQTLTAVFGNYSLVVLPFVEGINGFNRALSEKQWLEFGKTLRKIHELKIPSTPSFGRENYSPEKRDFVRSLFNGLDQNTNSDEIALATAQLIQKHRKTILALVDQAESFASKLQSSPPLSVLCHTDLHAGNILLSHDQEFYIVDWDSPLLAPKERDLMFIGGGVGGIWNLPEEVALFYQGYGKTSPDPRAIRYYRSERILVDIAEYARELVLTQKVPENKAELFKNFSEIFDPGNVVEIALN